MSAPAIDRLGQARDAAAREAWSEAYELLRAHDAHPSRALTADDLMTLADAAWWSGHVDESVAARLRAHAAYVAGGDHRGAGLASWWLHHEYKGLGRPAAAAGWLHRAHHHLDDLPPCPEQCFVAWTDAEEATARGDRASALAAIRRMTGPAVRSGGPDLLALSRQAEASVLLAQGRRAEGFAQLDEAMRAVTAGELSGMFTGLLYCLAIDLCMRSADLARAVEWTNAAMEWCSPPWTGRRPAEPPPLGVTPSGENPFRGVCRAHRVAVLDLLGAWALAEAEARQACREVSVDCLEAAAAAYYTAGDVQRRQGRLEEAAVSYAHAHELGRIPQPGLALLRLAQGRVEAAVAGVGLALACDSGHDLLGRARLLAARTEVALAVGDVPGAAGAAAELEVLAGDVPLLRAMADTARGAVALAESRPEPARRLLRRALGGWLGLGVPYEAARVRVRLAAAGARGELSAARAVFERLGAVPTPVVGMRSAGARGSPPARAKPRAWGRVGTTDPRPAGARGSRS
ncbi:LuxR family transcriptional regulator [Streptomyces sp. NPDC008122]|uniref:LuxR family transcriptional regulator n=1 Tax=Streptomyces sp. NPDC008122 TaxID=3364810 RepID=UPI0036E52ECF